MFWIVVHAKPFQQLKVFLREVSVLVMFFLILDVSDNVLELRVRIAECTESLLPHEFTDYPPVLVDESSGTHLDVSDQIGDSNFGGDTYKDMDVIWH